MADEKKVKRLEALNQILEQAEEVKKTEKVALVIEGMKGKSVDTASYTCWHTRGEVFIIEVVGDASQYLKKFQQIHTAEQVVYSVRNVDAGIGVLQALKYAIEHDDL